MAGLVLPPCLMRLPAGLKLKIFESIPVVDLVNVGCVCSELQNLSSSNELWKQKFVEEFGNGTGAKGWIHWKINFKSFWERKKEREREDRISRVFPQLRVPNPFWRPSPFANYNLELSKVYSGDSKFLQ
nr:f-box protein skip22 [Quercus suber]